MSNLSKISPTSPSFTFGYWRPWKENSNFMDSYLDYTKDISLAKYGADIVGEYINQASIEQVDAINNLGQKIGLEINKLSFQLDDISIQLNFLNQNTEILIEQQKLTNILLHNISELLRVPDSEKERQHAIELGIKFFVNAQKDVDLLDDALEELLRAESLMKQDYFVLHRLGVIYLHSTKHLNVEKALEYFTKAAKYASVESDPKAMHLVNILSNKFNKSESNLKDNNTNITLKGVNDLPEETKREVAQIIEGRVERLSLKEALEIVNSAKNPIIKGITLKEAKAIDQTFKDVFLDIKVIISSSEIKLKQIKTDVENDDISEIQQLAAESYIKAAFSAYVLGQFELAVTYQSKALKFINSAESYLMLAKYQTRTKEIGSCVDNLEKAIDLKPSMAIAVFREIDLMNEPNVLKLIERKNKKINEKIASLINNYEKVNSEKVKVIINKLYKLKAERYDVKINEFKKYLELEKDFDNDISKIISKIDDLIDLINKSTYIIDRKEFNTTIEKLKRTKIDSLEEIQKIYDAAYKKHNDNLLKIGVKYGGGVVFYIDKSGKHGLIAANKNCSKAIWGIEEHYLKNTKSTINSGKKNTILIVENASYTIQKGWFSSNKLPCQTAARICTELNLSGFKDWYLPSIEELNLIFKSKKKIAGFDDYDFDPFWSSTEIDENKALSLTFLDGSEYDRYKSMNGNVRAIRSF